MKNPKTLVKLVTLLTLALIGTPGAARTCDECEDYMCIYYPPPPGGWYECYHETALHPEDDDLVCYCASATNCYWKPIPQASTSN